METDRHLRQCFVYIDLNMVRTGAVGHPLEWGFSGYNEIQKPRERYALIDYEELKNLLNFKSIRDLAEAHRGWVDASMKEGIHIRDPRWTESVAVGSESFVTGIKNELGFRAGKRRIIGGDDSFILKESRSPYKGNSEGENTVLSPQNTYFWKDI